MNIIKKLLLGLMLLSSTVSQASSTLNLGLNSLPAPAWIQAVEITESKIKIEWAQVSGAVQYKVTRFDVTNNVQLPDVFVTEAEFTSQPHDPGTTIQFEVAAVDGNNVVGEAINAEYTTSIIIIDIIASFTVPNVPGGSATILPGGFVELSLPNADKTESNVIVLRNKLSFGTHFAEFLTWSHCIDQDQPGTRIQYYQENNWPTSVSKVEIGNPDQGYIQIKFYINGTTEFFTLLQPAYIQEQDQAKLYIRNDLKGEGNQINFLKSSNTETNPCYVPPGLQAQDTPETLDPNATSDDNDEASITASIMETIKSQMLLVSPNPFQDEIKVEYQVAQDGPVQVHLTSLTGKVVQNINFDSLPMGTYTAFFTTKALPAGMYLLTVQSQNGRTTVPVVKH